MTPHELKARILSISDVHLGHSKTQTSHILKNLYAAVPDQAWMDEVDLIIIAGDLFDQLLDFNDPNAFLIKRWMRWFLSMCKRRKIKVHVLEGTSSHDYTQNKWMLEVNETVEADLLYIDTLSIVHDDDLKLDILYIPDEWRGNQTDETWKDAVAALQNAGLQQVDFTVIHGTMHYQVPPHFGIQTHNTDRYLEITRHYVLTGHIHQSAVYNQRALSNGSFDRLTHGDEGRKGYWDLDIRPTGDKVVFRENPGAKIYRTIDVRELGHEFNEAFLTLHELPDDSHIRLEVNSDSPALAALDVIKKTYPLLNWTTKKADRADVQKNLFQDTRGQFQQTNFTRQNLPQILMERIRQRHTDPALLAMCEAELNENLG